MKIGFCYFLLFLSLFSCAHAVITITPERDLIKIQVFYSLFYQGIVIDPVSAVTDPSTIEIIAFKGHKPSGDTKDTITGLAILQDIAGKALTCGIASALPWSDSAYYLAVYEIDPATKNQVKQLAASEVIKVRRARELEIRKAHAKARVLKQDIYAPLFLKGVTLKKRHIAAGAAVALLVARGSKLAYDTYNQKQQQEKQNSLEEQEDEVRDKYDILRGKVLNIQRNKDQSKGDYGAKLRIHALARKDNGKLTSAQIDRLNEIDRGEWDELVRLNPALTGSFFWNSFCQFPGTRP